MNRIPRSAFPIAGLVFICVAIVFYIIGEPPSALLMLVGGAALISSTPDQEDTEYTAPESNKGEADRAHTQV